MANILDSVCFLGNAEGDRDVKRKEPKIYQLKVTLKDIRPPIWRRIQVYSNTPLLELHAILQAAMGWFDSHLHQFVVGKTYYGLPDIDEFGDSNLKDERRARLDQLLSNSRRKIIYEYDFGDGWEHEILLKNSGTGKPREISALHWRRPRLPC